VLEVLFTCPGVVDDAPVNFACAPRIGDTLILSQNAYRVTAVVWDADADVVRVYGEFLQNMKLPGTKVPGTG
jgi:hypothetical protein